MSMRDFCRTVNEELELLHAELLKIFESEQERQRTRKPRKQDPNEEFYEHELKGVFYDLYNARKSSQYLAGNTGLTGTVHRKFANSYYIEMGRKSIVVREGQELEYRKTTTGYEGYTVETWHRGTVREYNGKLYISGAAFEKELEGLTVRIRAPKPMKAEDIKSMLEYKQEVYRAGLQALKQGAAQAEQVAPAPKAEPHPAPAGPRKKKERQSERMNLLFTPTMKQRINKLAEKQGTSTNKAIQAAVEQYLLEHGE